MNPESVAFIEKNLYFTGKTRQLKKKYMPSSAEYKTIKATQVRIAASRFYGLLEDGRELGIPYDWCWRLAEATPEQLNNWRLISGGQGVF